MGVTNEQWKDLADFAKMYMHVRGVVGRIQYRPFCDDDEMHIDMGFSDRDGHGPDFCQHVVVRRKGVENYIEMVNRIVHAIDRFANGHPKVLKASEVDVVEIQEKLRKRDDSVSVYPYMFVARQNGKTLMQVKMIEEYLKTNVEEAKRLVTSMYGINACYGTMPDPFEDKELVASLMKPEIKDVIFNDPATIVFWADGTKTVVKADKEDFDPEKGLAMAISKKVLGNKGNYFDIFKKWTSTYKRPVKELDLLGSCGDDICKSFAEGMRHAAEAARKLAMETRDDAVEGNLFLASDELRGVLNRKRATKNDMVKSIRYALERLDHARLHFIKKKEN